MSFQKLLDSKLPFSTSSSSAITKFKYAEAKSPLLRCLESVLYLFAVPFLAIALVFLAISSFFFRRIGTTFAFRETAFNRDLLNEIVDGVGHYMPPWWYNLHLGSLLPFGRSPQLTFERQLLEHDGGAQFIVDWYPTAPANLKGGLEGPQSVHIFLPGLGLSSDANVAQVYAKHIADRGCICGVLVPRGHPTSGCPWKTPNPWHAGSIDDLLLTLKGVLEAAELSKSQLKVFIAGYSASTNIIAMALKELAEDCPNYFQPEAPMEVIGGLLVCANYDYIDTRNKLESTFMGNVYSRLLVTQFKMFLDSNEHMHEKLDPEAVKKMKAAHLMSELDAAAFKTYGYKTLDEMYRSLSPKFIIDKIPVPLLVVVAFDDPLYIFSHGSVQRGIPLEAYTNNPNVFFMEPSHGNHFGFYSGPISEMYTNSVSYVHPPKLAMSLIATITATRAVAASPSSISLSANEKNNANFVMEERYV